MINSQQEKRILLFVDTLTAAATDSATFDRLNYDYISLDLFGSSADAVSNKPTAIVLSHADTSNGTTTALSTGGTDFTIPNAVTSGSQYIANWEITGNKYKRYLKLAITAATSVRFTAVARLGRGKVLPSSSTGIGAGAQHVLY